MVSWFYGYSHSEVLDLGLPQFHDRVLDISSITEMENGKGKGRITRDVEVMKAAMARGGMRPPAEIA